MREGARSLYSLAARDPDPKRALPWVAPPADPDAWVPDSPGPIDRPVRWTEASGGLRAGSQAPPLIWGFRRKGSTFGGDGGRRGPPRRTAAEASAPPAGPGAGPGNGRVFAQGAADGDKGALCPRAPGTAPRPSAVPPRRGPGSRGRRVPDLPPPRRGPIRSAGPGGSREAGSGGCSAEGPWTRGERNPEAGVHRVGPGGPGGGVRPFGSRGGGGGQGGPSGEELAGPRGGGAAVWVRTSGPGGHGCRFPAPSPSSGRPPPQAHGLDPLHAHPPANNCPGGPCREASGTEAAVSVTATQQGGLTCPSLFAQLWEGVADEAVGSTPLLAGHTDVGGGGPGDQQRSVTALPVPPPPRPASPSSATPPQACPTPGPPPAPSLALGLACSLPSSTPLAAACGLLPAAPDSGRCGITPAPPAIQPWMGPRPEVVPAAAPEATLAQRTAPRCPASPDGPRGTEGDWEDGGREPRERGPGGEKGLAEGAGGWGEAGAGHTGLWGLLSTHQACAGPPNPAILPQPHPKAHFAAAFGAGPQGAPGEVGAGTAQRWPPGLGEGGADGQGSESTGPGADRGRGGQTPGQCRGGGWGLLATPVSPIKGPHFTDRRRGPDLGAPVRADGKGAPTLSVGIPGRPGGGGTRLDCSQTRWCLGDPSGDEGTGPGGLGSAPTALRAPAGPQRPGEASGGCRCSQGACGPGWGGPAPGPAPSHPPGGLHARRPPSPTFSGAFGPRCPYGVDPLLPGAGQGQQGDSAQASGSYLDRAGWRGPSPAPLPLALGLARHCPLGSSRDPGMV
ncbi:collagen alpha-1(I) chain-like [Choloepus didactylus]|uniref:collagen alpha-1(I) chain-like n=1 Tax=Choloepus didactylus TaxID=27675 RepID=UPI00189E83C5|nr:collagen alpha-1(I) chain-like [Choloepus didactylus]